MIKELLISIWILHSIPIISTSKIWTFIDKLDHLEYCCKCHKNFERSDLIDECYQKNINDTRLPFCNCHRHRYPECPETTTICNRLITCPDTLAYKECEVPFLNDAKLVCNDNLEWEPNFTCPPECTNVTEICNTKVNCNETYIGSECVLPFNTSQKLICGGDQQWKSDFKCLPDSESKKPSTVEIVLIVVGVLVLVCIGCIVYCFWKRKKSGLSSTPNSGHNETEPMLTVQVNGGPSRPQPTRDPEDITPNAGNEGNYNGQVVNLHELVNGGPGRQQQNGNPQDNTPIAADEDNYNAEMPAEPVNGGPGRQQQNGNPQDNTPIAADEDIYNGQVVNLHEPVNGREGRPQQNRNPQDNPPITGDEGTTPIQETGPGFVPDSSNEATGGSEALNNDLGSLLYNDGLSSLPVHSFSPSSLVNLDRMEINSRDNAQSTS